MLPVEVSSENLVRDSLSTPIIDAILTCNDSKTRFVLAVINKSPDRAVAFRPDFVSMKLAVPEKVSALVLSGRTPDDYNDIGAEERVCPVKMCLDIKNGVVFLPAHSLSVIILNSQDIKK